jgi:SOS response associated peptidase (SRAP)
MNIRSGAQVHEGAVPHPASHFFEFTGAKPPKSKWKFTKAGEDWFCFAELCRPMPDGAGEAFTLLTTEPGPDGAPIHDRQMVVLDRSDWLAWLNLTRPNPSCFARFPPGAWRSNRFDSPIGPDRQRGGPRSLYQPQLTQLVQQDPGRAGMAVRNQNLTATACMHASIAACVY